MGARFVVPSSFLEQRQRIGGGEDSGLHNVQFFHGIQTFLNIFSC